jgi:CRP-like cAMP-binding protein
LPADEFARLLPHLEPCAVKALDVLADLQRPLEHVYFPETAIVSVLRRMRDGTMIETYGVGREGMIGIPNLFGDAGSPACTVLGEVPGLCRRMSLATLRRLISGLPTLERRLHTRLLVLLDEVQQAAGCNSLHTVEQRCARWLLMTHDRVGSDEFLLTHEVLAQMLAVRRAGVTVAAGMLQRAGLLSYSRGHIRILDRSGLEAAACECYHVIQSHAVQLLGEDVSAG